MDFVINKFLFVVLFAFSTSTFASFDLDVDDNGDTDALTDGLLVLRHMFGLSGDTLAMGVVGSGASRSEPDAIESHLTAAGEKLDVDGDGDVDALTDGLLILRDLFGLSGDALVTGVLSDSSERKTSDQVISYLATIKDSDNDDVVDSSDAFPFDSSEALDTDRDGIGNNTDTDDDGDGVMDDQDPAPLMASISDQETYDGADFDGDGVTNGHDADDDGDGVLDGVDTNPTDASIDKPLLAIPWINGLKLSAPDWADGRNELIVELAISVDYKCNDQTRVVLFDDGGNEVSSEWVWPLKCDSSDLSLNRSWNGYHFLTVGLWAPETSEGSGEWVTLPTHGSITLIHDDTCVEVVEFGATSRRLGKGPCQDEIFETETEELALDQWHERGGTGLVGADFLDWYVFPDSGYLNTHDRLNHYQRITWAEPETTKLVSATELAMLEIPKPRSTKIKGLQDAGFSKPPRNDDRLKVFSVSEINDEVLAHDGESSYVFASPYLRSDFLDYLDHALGGFVAIMGSPRATNLAHHFDYPEASQVLTDLAFQRGHLDTKACGKDEFQRSFAFAGQGGGYHGMGEEELTNDGRVPVHICDGNEEIHTFMAPLKANDPSWGQNQDHPVDLMTEGSPIDLSQPSYPCCFSSSFREGELMKWLHEFTHNWEAQHIIAGRSIGPKRFATIRPDWADNPIMHGTSTMLELYYIDNVLDEAAYDGGQDVQSTRQQIENRIRDGWPDLTIDYAQKFAEGDQGFEGDFANYLIREFGLEKLYSEFYRREASSGDYRVALHQTYGKPHLELFADADAWMRQIGTADDYRLFFDSAEAFHEAFSPSFNVSFLQARNDFSPNARYQTLYTFVGEGTPSGVGTMWLPVDFVSSDSIILHDGVDAVVSRSASGQLKINEYDAYFYSGDSSVFHAGGLAVSDEWSAFTRYGERTSDLWFPVFIYDHDNDGLPDDYDPDYQAIYFTGDGRYKLDVWPDDEGFIVPGQQSETAFSN
jgi:hypothetical protein